MPNICVNGIDIAYDIHGPADAPVILLIMGLGLPSAAWPPELVQLLVEQGFRVLTFDNRDSGRSELLNGLATPNIAWQALRFFLRLRVKAPYGIPDMASDTRELLSALDIDRAHVVGVSMGGMIAQQMAIDSPGIVCSLTSMMSTTSARKLPGPSRAIRRLMIKRPPGASQSERIAHFRKLWRLLSSPGYPEDEARFDGLMQRIFARGMPLEGLRRQTLAVAAAADRTSKLARIRVPTLVIHGDADAMLPVACGYRTAEAICDAEMVVIEGMGHNLPVPLLDRLSSLIAAHARRAIAATRPTER